MIRHIVMWQFKDEAEGNTGGQNCLLVKEMLEKLPSRIPFIKRLEVGINEYPGPMSADMVLITEFESKEDLDLYAGHPSHVIVSDFVSKVRSSRMVVDYHI